MAIYRDGRAIPPEGDTRDRRRDEIFFLAGRETSAAPWLSAPRDDPARRVMIAGGGNIGWRLAATLEKNNQVKLIERDATRARATSRSWRGDVLHGDAADEELLIEENIDSAGRVRGQTNSEEANILAAS